MSYQLKPSCQWFPMFCSYSTMKFFLINPENFTLPYVFEILLWQNCMASTCLKFCYVIAHRWFSWALYIKLHLLWYYFFFFFRPQEFPFDYYFHITFSVGLWGSATQSRIWLDDCHVKNHVTYLRERINVITFNP